MEPDQPPIRLLTIEDSEDDHELVLQALRQAKVSVNATRVESREQLTDALCSGQTYDIVLSDYHLPSFSGIEALEVVKNHDEELPFILLSGTIGERTAVEAMRAGASDYLMKENLARLGVAITREVHASRARAQSRQTLRETEERLRQAQKMEAIGQLSGGIAHDFNNILAAILLHVESLEEKAELASSAKELISIRAAAERAVVLIKQLLTFSRKSPFSASRVDINSRVQGIAELLKRLIPGEIQLETKLVPGEAVVKTDPAQLDQVILNLAINARDAMGDSGGVLTIATRVTEVTAPISSIADEIPVGTYTVLEVSDTGCGIDPTVLSRIFEPFFTTKEPGKGTGLGLSTVYGITKSSGGFVRVNSALGQGSTFAMFFGGIEE